jgi:hypothetical protein
LWRLCRNRNSLRALSATMAEDPNLQNERELARARDSWPRSSVQWLNEEKRGRWLGQTVIADRGLCHSGNICMRIYIFEIVWLQNSEWHSSCYLALAHREPRKGLVTAEI